MNNSFQKPPLSQLHSDFGPVHIMYDNAVFVPQKSRFEILPPKEFRTLIEAIRYAFNSPNFKSMYLTWSDPESGILWRWDHKELERECKKLVLEV